MVLLNAFGMIKPLWVRPGERVSYPTFVLHGLVAT
jgi:hypothetical protein